MSYNNTRQDARTPITLRIKFKSATIEDFIGRFSVDVSAGGIFIRTNDPLPVGTAIIFEFQLADATPLINGTGTIVWTRDEDSTRAGVAAGMGVRFDELTQSSKEILDRILMEKARSRPGKRMATGDRSPSKTEAELDQLRDRSKRPTAIDLASQERARSGQDDDPFEDATSVGSLPSHPAQGADPFDDSEIQTAVATRAELQAAVERTREVVIAEPSIDYNQARSLPVSEDELTVGVQHSELATPPPDNLDAHRHQEQNDDEELAQWKADRERKKKQAKAEAARKIAEAARDPKRKRVKHRLLSEQMALAGARPEEIQSRLGSEPPPSQGSALWIAAGILLLVGGALAGYYFLVHSSEKPSKSQVIRRPPTNDSRKLVATPSGAKLMVESSPTGANVKLEPTGKSGTTPFTFSGLELGNSYTVRLSMPAYRARTVSVVAKNTTTPKPFTLEPLPRSLVVVTDPPSAKIYINGRRVGRSPRTVDLADDLSLAREFAVELKKSGYESITLPVIVSQAGKEDNGVWLIEIDEELQRRAPRKPQPDDEER